jgi:ketosteroid isomerase-like protein
MAAVPKGDARIVAEIRRLEHEWGQAFVKRDFALIERIVAPEFRLAVGAPDGKAALAYRDEWMRNARAFRTEAFQAEVIDVATAGNVAVALVGGQWTVQRRPDRPAATNRFLVTDTWVKRNGRWQVIYRYSHRLP